MLSQLIQNQLELISKFEFPSFKRYLFSQINWDSRLIAILGARGVGKTTMLLQYYKEHFDNPEKCLYILGDDGDVLNIGLRKIARQFSLKGGKVLIVDEVHKYPKWSQQVKNIYDTRPDLRIILSGSSNINISREKYDLSRRLVAYRLAGLSLREFINLETGLGFKPAPLKKIFKDHLKISQEISAKLKKEKQKKILQHFESYLHYGYYPYYREGVSEFEGRLENAIDKVLHEDIPAAHDLSHTSIVSLKKLIALVGSSHPFTVDISSIARNLSITRKSVYSYIDYLLKAELLMQGKTAGSGSRLVRKPAKLFLNNPNLYFVVGKLLSFESKIGALRETFVFNQLFQKHRLNIPKKGDVLVDGLYHLEIGGRSKKTDQLKGLRKAYVVKDNIEFGYEKKIPLYLLGFLY